MQTIKPINNQSLWFRKYTLTMQYIKSIGKYINCRRSLAVRALVF